MWIPQYLDAHLLKMHVKRVDGPTTCGSAWVCAISWFAPADGRGQCMVRYWGLHSVPRQPWWNAALSKPRVGVPKAGGVRVGMPRGGAEQ